TPHRPTTVGRPYAADGLNRPTGSTPAGNVVEELARVEHAAVLPDFEVHMGAGGAAGGAGLGHFLADPDQIAHPHRVAGVVGVAGDVAVAMVHFHHVAVAGAPARIADHAVGHGHDRIAAAGAEIHPPVEGATAPERVGAVA